MIKTLTRCTLLALSLAALPALAKTQVVTLGTGYSRAKS